jgi:transcriptional regulator with XRE-family HTH domain
VPWREAFPYTDEELPGVFLSGARYREGLTQVQLSKRSGIPRRHISEMENNKRPIGKQNARKLAKALNVDPRRFLRARI